MQLEYEIQHADHKEIWRRAGVETKKFSDFRPVWRWT
jgi:hypothetical protein